MYLLYSIIVQKVLNEVDVNNDIGVNNEIV